MADQIDPARLARLAFQAITTHADEYAEFLLCDDGYDSWAKEVELVVAFAGFTPRQFLENYWAGEFHV